MYVSASSLQAVMMSSTALACTTPIVRLPPSIDATALPHAVKTHLLSRTLNIFSYTPVRTEATLNLNVSPEDHVALVEGLRTALYDPSEAKNSRAQVIIRGAASLLGLYTEQFRHISDKNREVAQAYIADAVRDVTGLLDLAATLVRENKQGGQAVDGLMDFDQADRLVSNGTRSVIIRTSAPDNESILTV